jgi:Flp pilus assembly protein CpaB
MFSNGDAATTTILQNVKVIAYGRQLDPAAKVDPRDTSRPTVATLLVSREQAQRLVLAQQRGRIQLALRNGMDDGVSDWSDPINSADLGIEEPRKPAPAVMRIPQASPSVAAAKAKAVEGHVVWIYRGDKLTQETIK